MTRAVRAIVVLLLALVPVLARAQDASFGLGPKAGLYVNDANVLFGLLADIPITQRVCGDPAVEILTGTRKTTSIVTDYNIRYYFGRPGTATGFFVIGGFGLRIDLPDVGSAQVGFRVNTGAGIVFDPISFVQPWAGLKIYLLDQKGSDVALEGGLLVRL